MAVFFFKPIILDAGTEERKFIQKVQRTRKHGPLSLLIGSRYDEIYLCDLTPVSTKKGGQQVVSNVWCSHGVAGPPSLARLVYFACSSELMRMLKYTHFQ